MDELTEKHVRLLRNTLKEAIDKVMSVIPDITTEYIHSSDDISPCTEAKDILPGYECVDTLFLRYGSMGTWGVSLERNLSTGDFAINFLAPKGDNDPDRDRILHVPQWGVGRIGTWILDTETRKRMAMSPWKPLERDEHDEEWGRPALIGRFLHGVITPPLDKEIAFRMHGVSRIDAPKPPPVVEAAPVEPARKTLVQRMAAGAAKALTKVAER